MAIHLITGDDESLVLGAAGEVVKRLVGDDDRTLMVDDFDGDEYELRAVVDAAQTPPFLTDKRVVVARGVGRFDEDAVAVILGYLDDPLPSTELVLVAGRGRMPKVLTDALKKADAAIVDSNPPSRARERPDRKPRAIRRAPEFRSAACGYRARVPQARFLRTGGRAFASAAPCVRALRLSALVGPAP